MAYYRNDNLITQGDGELVTIASCVSLIGEVAPFFYEDPTKVKKLQDFCIKLAGTIAMTFMFTPSDPLDAAPVPHDFDDKDLLGPIWEAIPELGETEHAYEGGIATFIVGALRFRTLTTPCDDKEERDYTSAMLILEQLNT